MWPQWGLCIFVGAPVAFAVNFMPVSGLPPPQSITLMRLCDCDLYSLCVPAEFQFSAAAERPERTLMKALQNLCAFHSNTPNHISGICCYIALILFGNRYT